MSTFRAALRGTSWALAAQVVTGFGQIAYSALTARLFSPNAFGEFTAALSLQGLIVLCTATGLTSFVLKEAHLRRSQLRAINVALYCLGLLGAALFWLVSPLWLDWLNSPGGAQFVPLLCWATFAAPIGAVQLALLRRDGDGRADALVYVLGFVAANGLAALCAILTHASWTLAVGAAVNPIILTALSRVMRRAVYPVEPSRLSFDWLPYTLRVTGQSLVFYGLAQSPTWSLGANTSTATLGQFSRGNALATLPAYALGTAMMRGTQPHWRKIQTDESRVRGVSEALRLAASVSFMGFAVLAALADPLTRLWLGPGWDLAAEFTVWLAIGFAMQVPTGLLANYLEMTAELSRVRWIQVANAMSLGVGIALLVWQQDFRFLLGGFVLSHCSGLITAVLQLSETLGVRRWWLLTQLIPPLLSAIGAGGVAFGVTRTLALGVGTDSGLGGAVQLCGGAIAVIAFIFVTRKWQPAYSILVARGVIRRGI